MNHHPVVITGAETRVSHDLDHLAALAPHLWLPVSLPRQPRYAGSHALVPVISLLNGLAETGRIGMGCDHPADMNDVHFLKDAFALIQNLRQAPGSAIMVDAFCFTLLLPSAPKLMLNVESDDYGLLEKRSCGCPLEAYGFTEHLRHICSFHKLTGERVTLVGSEMVHILEEILPARFGGSPMDYQLLEEEDEQGFTRFSLVISPKVEIADESQVVGEVMDALAHGSIAAGCARDVWSQAETLRMVKRMEPIWTARGKLMPLHLVRRSERPIDAATRFISDFGN